MVKRFISKRRHLATLIITICIFIIGLLIGSLINETKFSTIIDIQSKFKTQILSLEIQYDLLEEDICKVENPKDLEEELYEIGAVITDLEFELGKNDKRVLELAEYYSLLEVRHWLFMKTLKKQCGKRSNLILYFYSNLGDCGECEEQGYILTTLRKKYPDLRIYIYSFNLNIDNPALNTLKDMYGVTKVPSVIVNDKLYDKYITIQELERILGKS